MLREFLRRRRGARQVAKDDAKDALLSDDAGKSEYWQALAGECAKSSLIGLLEEALKQPGDIVECGVFRGASLRRISKTVKDIAPERTVFGLDSFEGFPSGGINEDDTTLFRSEARLMGKFTNAEDVPGRLTKFADTFGIKLDLRRGFFEKTLPGITGRPLAFLHIDCDTYSGHIEVLDALFDHVVPGGIIVLDDYHTEAWPGATKAVDEFLSDKPETVQQSTERETPAWYIVKEG